MRRIEVKVKFVNNLQDWETIPVTFETVMIDDDKFKILMKHLRELSLCKLVHEIRWNEKGSPQGHYIVNLFGEA